MKHSPLQAVIFDLDGTLIRLTDHENHLFAQAIRAAHRIDMIDLNWDHYPSRNDIVIAETILTQHGIPATPDHLAEIFYRYTDLVARHLESKSYAVPVIPGAVAFMHSLQGAGIDILLATNNWGDVARLRLKAAGFPELRGAFADDGDDKPEILACLLRRYPGLHEKHCLYFGDSTSDARAAAQFDMRFIGITADPVRGAALSDLNAADIWPDFTNRSLESLSSMR